MQRGRPNRRLPTGNGGLALLFPGQGSQTRDMRRLVDRHWPGLAGRACELVGDDPFERASEGTRFAQPAIFCANLAGWRALDEEAAPVAVAGHSLGEFAALVATGCLDAEVGLSLVVTRGRLMQEAGEQGPPGGMLAVSGVGAEQALGLLGDLDVVIANYNSRTQVVLSGPLAAVERALARLRDDDVRAVRLPVSGAFHSRLMEPVLGPFREAIARAPLKATSSATAICSTTCAPFSDLRHELVGGLVRPVLWRQTIEAIRARGRTRFVEVGPGRVLTRLLERGEGGGYLPAPSRPGSPAKVGSSER